MASFYVVVLALALLQHIGVASTAVVELDDDTFHNFVVGNRMTLLYLYDWECSTCQLFLSDYDGLANHLDSRDSKVKLGKLDVTKHRHLVDDYNVGRLPALLFFRKRMPILYTGNLAVDSISTWLDENQKSYIRRLDEDNFEHLTQASTGATTGDWLIQFSSPGCEACKLLRPHWEAVASHLRHKMNTAIVDLSVNQALARRFRIHHTPTIILFRQGRRYTYKTHNNDYTFQPIVSFAIEDYRRVKGIDVEGQKSYLAELFGSFRLNEYTVLYVCLGLIAVVVIVGIVWACKMAAEDDGLEELSDDDDEKESESEEGKKDK